MIIGSLKEVSLTRAKEIFLFDCRVAGLDLQEINVYRSVLTSFIRFTGNVRVRQLTVSHVDLYLTNLSDGPNEGEEHDQWVMTHYVMIHTWIRWIYSQKFITERENSLLEAPRLTNLFPWQLKRSLTYCC